MPKDIERWFESLSFTSCRTGVKLDLRVRVYPNGNGYLIALRDDGTEGSNQPVNNVGEATAALARLWSQGMEACPNVQGNQ